MTDCVFCKIVHHEAPADYIRHTLRQIVNVKGE